MKRLLMAGIAITLSAAGAAQAQRWQERPDGQDAPAASPTPQPARPSGRFGDAGPRLGGQPPAAAPAPAQAAPAQPPPQSPPTAARPGRFGDAGASLRGAQPGPDRGGRADTRPGPDRPGPDRRGPDGRDFDRPGDRGRDWRAPQRYRAPAYRAPRGYAYRGWGLGQYLPRAYFADSYVLYDYWRYGLRRPPAGMVWVRSGPDAILIDRVNGRIYEVVRYLFW